jgi:prevent-host-death family protein
MWLRLAKPRGYTKPRQAELPPKYNTGEARDLFTHLLRRVRRGEEIVIAHAGRPVAKLVPYSSDAPHRHGVIRTQIIVQDDRRV